MNMNLITIMILLIFFLQQINYIFFEEKNNSDEFGTFILALQKNFQFSLK